MRELLDKDRNMESNAAILGNSNIPAGSYNECLNLDPAAVPKNNLFQTLHDQGYLDSLLIDRTTGGNIIWATDIYSDLGKGFDRMERISPELICGRDDHLASIRKDRRADRTRKHGEVATPLSVCKTMCDYAHETLMATDWRKYVDSKVLEITCGEAPFLASRRDPGSGADVPIGDRVGILDRKLRVITENAKSRVEWLQWAFRAYEATYGYEFQGFNLLMARINLLMTFREYLAHFFGALPTQDEYARLLDIVSWNIWQMDGLTGRLPYGNLTRDEQYSFFETGDKVNETPVCLIKDWKTGKIITWLSCGDRK